MYLTVDIKRKTTQIFYTHLHFTADVSGEVGTASGQVLWKVMATSGQVLYKVVAASGQVLWRCF